MKMVTIFLSTTLLAASLFGNKSGVFKDIRESVESFSIDRGLDLKSGASFWWSASDDGKIWLYGGDGIEVAVAKGVKTFLTIPSPNTYSFSSLQGIKLEVGEIAILKNRATRKYVAIKPTRMDGSLLSGEWQTLEQFSEYKYAKNPIDSRCTIFPSSGTIPDGWRACTKEEYEDENPLRATKIGVWEKLSTLPSGWSMFGASISIKGSDLPDTIKRIARYDAGTKGWQVIDLSQTKDGFASSEYEGFWVYK